MAFETYRDGEGTAEAVAGDAPDPKDLTDLDACLLRDIGISREEARLEMRKSIYLHWTAELLPPHHHAPIKFPVL
ncbi:hypothetical protein G6L63_07175 [Agrobacterium vitis]|nr:hypothetical protein [Agrobacterium vitis]